MPLPKEIIYPEVICSFKVDLKQRFTADLFHQKGESFGVG